MTSVRTVSRLSRILALIPYVLEKGSVTVDEILDRFDYTIGQLTRDLDTVFVCGLPGYGPGDLMEAFIDQDEVVIDAAGYFSNAPRLTPTEALGLLASGMTVAASGQGSPALSRAVDKLSRSILQDADSTLTVDVLDESARVGSLRQAASDQFVISIVYRSVGKEEVTQRDVEPWSVFTALGRWYLTGYCRLVRAERTFRVDRIKELEVTSEPFERPENVPEPGVGYSSSDDDVVSEISLNSAARWVLEYYPVEILAEGSTTTTVKFSSPDAEVPARLLLRLGADAKLLKGDEVAARVAELGKQILAKHQ